MSEQGNNNASSPSLLAQLSATTFASSYSPGGTTTKPHIPDSQLQPAYVTYFAIGETYVTVVLEIATVIIIGFLLFLQHFRPWKLKVTSLSGCLLVYLSVHLLGNATSIPYGLYRIARWRPLPDRQPNVGMYDAYVLYWVGLPEVVYMSIGPVPVVFLTLERILSMHINQLANRVKEVLPYFALCAALAVYCFNFFIYLLELPLDLAYGATCEFVPCEMAKYRGVPQLFLKMAFGSVNLVSSCYFMWLLKKQASTTINDRVVRLTICIEIFADMVPTYAGFFFNVFTGVSGSRYLGEDISMLVSFETAIVGAYYLRTLYDPKATKTKPGQHQSTSTSGHLRGHNNMNTFNQTMGRGQLQQQNAPGVRFGGAVGGAGGGQGGQRWSAARRNTVAAVWPVASGNVVFVGPGVATTGTACGSSCQRRL